MEGSQPQLNSTNNPDNTVGLTNLLVAAVLVLLDCGLSIRNLMRMIGARLL